MNLIEVRIQRRPCCIFCFSFSSSTCKVGSVPRVHWPHDSSQRVTRAAWCERMLQEHGLGPAAFENFRALCKCHSPYLTGKSSVGKTNVQQKKREGGGAPEADNQGKVEEGEGAGTWAPSREVPWGQGFFIRPPQSASETFRSFGSLRLF